LPNDLKVDLVLSRFPLLPIRYRGDVICEGLIPNGHLSWKLELLYSISWVFQDVG